MKRLPWQLNMVAVKEVLRLVSPRVVQTSGGMLSLLLMRTQPVLPPRPKLWLSGLSMLMALLLRSFVNRLALRFMMVKTMSILLLLILSMLNGCGTSTKLLRANRPMNRVGPVREVTNGLRNASCTMWLASLAIRATLMPRCGGKNLVVAVLVIILRAGAKAATLPSPSILSLFH